VQVRGLQRFAGAQYQLRNYDILRVCNRDFAQLAGRGRHERERSRSEQPVPAHQK
jgi:hypothetical protein